METPQVIVAGKTLGILGGGQLGMMSAEAAKALGYRVVVFENSADCPAARVCDVLIVGDFKDEARLAAFLDAVDAITLEFENIPTEALRWLQQHGNGKPVAPSAETLWLTQNRLREKTWLQENGIAVTPFVPVLTLAELIAGVETVGIPCVVKTAGLGYDGKGQRKISTPTDCQTTWQVLSDGAAGPELILEQWVPYELEFSVLVARNAQGQCIAYEPIVNYHENHILDVSVVPSGFSLERIDAAKAMARRIVEAMGFVGLLCVECFLTTDGRILVNELAPRPHNSGHLTLEASQTSQFEQHIRAVCNLPLGPTDWTGPAAMVNLLGDLWQAGPPHWERLEAMPNTYLHLYGKRDAKPGRKMGHMTVTASTAEAAVAQAMAARAALGTAPVRS